MMKKTIKKWRRQNKWNEWKSSFVCFVSLCFDFVFVLNTLYVYGYSHRIHYMFMSVSVKEVLLTAMLAKSATFLSIR